MLRRNEDGILKLSLQQTVLLFADLYKQCETEDEIHALRGHLLTLVEEVAYEIIKKLSAKEQRNSENKGGARWQD